MGTLIQSQDNTVTIKTRTHMPIGNIKTVTSKINLYAHWISEYGYDRDTYATPSGNINIVSRNTNLHAQ